MATINPDNTQTGATHTYTVTGTGFDGNTRVRVDGQYVDVTVASPTSLTFSWTAPATPGSAAVRVSRGGDYVDTTILVTAVPPTPTVTAVTPVTGPAAGGTAVTITGTGFREGA